MCIDRFSISISGIRIESMFIIKKLMMAGGGRPDGGGGGSNIFCGAALSAACFMAEWLVAHAQRAARFAQRPAASGQRPAQRLDPRTPTDQ